MIASNLSPAAVHTMLAAGPCLVYFAKKDGTTRRMVTAPHADGCTAKNGIARVFDAEKGAWRSVNLRTVTDARPLAAPCPRGASRSHRPGALRGQDGRGACGRHLRRLSAPPPGPPQTPNDGFGQKPRAGPHRAGRSGGTGHERPVQAVRLPTASVPVRTLWPLTARLRAERLKPCPSTAALLRGLLGPAQARQCPFL